MLQFSRTVLLLVPCILHPHSTATQQQDLYCFGSTRFQWFVYSSLHSLLVWLIDSEKVASDYTQRTQRHYIMMIYTRGIPVGKYS